MARKEKKYHFIYKTTNVLSGKYYIGMHSTDDLNDGYLGSGNRLRRSVKKYGKDNFVREILEYCETREELYLREEEIVNLNEIAKVDCINLIVGGRLNGFIDEEHMLKCSKAGGKVHAKKMLIDDDYYKAHLTWFSKIVKQAHKDGKYNYGISFKGKKHSDESKQKISESMKGKGRGSSNSQFGKCWITNEIESKKINRGDLIPEGWRLGRKIKKRE